MWFVSCTYLLLYKHNTFYCMHIYISWYYSVEVVSSSEKNVVGFSVFNCLHTKLFIIFVGTRWITSTRMLAQGMYFCCFHADIGFLVSKNSNSALPFLLHNSAEIWLSFSFHPEFASCLYILIFYCDFTTSFKLVELRMGLCKMAADPHLWTLAIVYSRKCKEMKMIWSNRWERILITLHSSPPPHLHLHFSTENFHF